MKDIFINEFPKNSKALVIMSGGMDSAIAARLSVEVCGKDNVEAISFFYKQKQSIELEYAKKNCNTLGIKHTLIDISFFGDMVRGVSANIVGGLPMPTIHDILGDPAPPSEVPNRNAIFFMIGASYAQVNNLNLIVTGVQTQDEYSYFDTTPNFITSINAVLEQNRKHDIQVYAPFQGKNKKQEILLLNELDNNIKLLESTITCYNPNEEHESCGICPSCSERIANFAKAGFKDNIKYSIDIDWDKLIEKYKK